jgi:hypothetical protein
MSSHARLVAGRKWQGAVFAVAVACCLSSCSRTKITVVDNEGSKESMDASLFQRDQPRIRHVLIWNGQIVVEADRFYSINLEEAVVTPSILKTHKRLSGWPLAEMAGH